MSTDPADVKMDVASRTPSTSSSSSKLFAIGGTIFVVLNLIALWVLHFVHTPESVDTATTLTASKFVQTTGLTASEGDAVSYGSDDVLRNGAGTTAYLNKLTLGADLTGTGYINFAPLGTSTSYTATNIMSYQRTTTDGTTDTVVTTVTYDAGSKTLTTEPVDTTNNVVSDKLQGLATLSDAQFVAVTLSSSYLAYIVPASIDGTAGTVTLNQDKRVQFATNSITNFVAPLSSTSFVAVYFDSYLLPSWGQRVSVGTVGSDGTITFSDDTPMFSEFYGDYSTNFGAPVSLSGLGSSSTQGFVVPYYTAVGWGSTVAADSVSGLCVASATFTPSDNSVSNFTTAVCHSTYRPSYFMGSVALGDNAMAMAFHDKANNNALTVAIVTVSPTDASLHFRSSYVFPEVSGDFEFGADPYGGFSTTPRLRVLSGNRLAVSFLNPTLSGKLSVRVLGFSPSTLALRELSPVLPVAAADFTLAMESDDTAKTGAVTHDIIPVGSDGFLAGYVGLRDGIVHQYFAVVEAFGEPVGVLDSVSKASVTVQGEAEVSGLTAGKVYYATTSGAVVTRDSASMDSESSEFFYTATNTMVVTTDSRLGVATDADTIFISPAL